MLTAKQEALLEFIESYQLEHGRSPTVREMREYFKVKSDNSILKPLKVLQQKGHIKKDDTPRGIALLPRIKQRLEAMSNVVTLPLFGKIPAGNPAHMEQNMSDSIPIHTGWVKDARASYMLEVKGDSMIDAGIFHGDVVIVAHSKQPKEGDIVAALIDGESTLKRLVKKNGAFFLKPENKSYKELYPFQELNIQGIVTGLFRHY